MGGKGKGNDKDNQLLKSADHMWDGKGRGTTMTIIDSNKLITRGGGKGRGMTSFTQISGSHAGRKEKGNDDNNHLLKSADHTQCGKGRNDNNNHLLKSADHTWGGKGRGMTKTIIYSNQLIPRGMEREGEAHRQSFTQIS